MANHLWADILLPIFILILCHIYRRRRHHQRLPDFVYPHFDPSSDFNVTPYRPFRWGNYPVHMGIRPMPWHNWIEIDHHYLHDLHIRKARVAAR